MEQRKIEIFLNSKHSFYITILITLIAWIGSIYGTYYGISNKIDLMAQTMTTHIEATKGLPATIAATSEKVAVLWEQRHNQTE